MCVPNWAQGTVQELTFSFTAHRESLGCDVRTDERNVVIDDVKIVSDPACVSDLNSFDLGFEILLDSGTTMSGWAVQDGEINGSVAPGTVVSDPLQSRSGNGLLSLSSTNGCNESTAIRHIVVPNSSGDAGPALRFFHNVPNRGGRSGVRLLELKEEHIVPEGEGWQQTIVCIPARLSGRPLAIEFFHHGNDTVGCNPASQETSLFDDVEITTDASCSS